MVDFSKIKQHNNPGNLRIYYAIMQQWSGKSKGDYDGGPKGIRMSCHNTRGHVFKESLSQRVALLEANKLLVLWRPQDYQTRPIVSHRHNIKNPKRRCLLPPRTAGDTCDPMFQGCSDWFLGQGVFNCIYTGENKANWHSTMGDHMHMWPKCLLSLSSLSVLHAISFWSHKPSSSKYAVRMFRVLRNRGSDGSYIRCGKSNGSPKKMCHRNIMFWHTIRPFISDAAALCCRAGDHLVGK